MLFQSAGSGKTNSIAWAAHFLADMHDAAKLFDMVLVVSDRNAIDTHLQETIVGGSLVFSLETLFPQRLIEMTRPQLHVQKAFAHRFRVRTVLPKLSKFRIVRSWFSY